MCTRISRDAVVAVYGLVFLYKFKRLFSHAFAFCRCQRPYHLAMKFLSSWAVFHFILYHAIAEQPTGCFWQISDIHLDTDYSVKGNPKKMCHEYPESTEDSEIGQYGNFLCDSPWILVKSAIRAMQDIQPNPDFIIWTGDNAPHRRDPSPDWTTVYRLLHNISLQLSDAFPKAQILPTIGNHDVSPPNKITPKNQSVYNDYLKKGYWEKLLPSSAIDSFLVGGFYSHIIQPGLRVISLNTLLWYSSNSFINSSIPDPGAQFAWLQKELENATESKEKVYIIGHIPPGLSGQEALNKVAGIPMYYDAYNERYTKIVSDYHSVIAGQFFGHIHQDLFGLIRNKGNGTVLSSYLLAPSVSPWHILTKKFVSPRAPNPSVRLYHYSRQNGTLLGFEQYFLNLTKANGQNSENKQVSNITGDELTSSLPSLASWELLYHFTDTYGLPDLSTTSLHNLYKALSNSTDEFMKYYYYSVAGNIMEPCSNICRLIDLCAISYVSAEFYRHCVDSAMSTVNDTKVATSAVPHVHIEDDVVSDETQSIVSTDDSHTVRNVLIVGSVMILTVTAIVAVAFVKQKKLFRGGRYVAFA